MLWGRVGLYQVSLLRQGLAHALRGTRCAAAWGAATGPEALRNTGWLLPTTSHRAGEKTRGSLPNARRAAFVQTTQTNAS